MLALLNTTINAVLWIVIMIGSTFFHEVGHIMMYRAFSNDKNWRIELGVGRPLFTFKKITINSFFMISGLALVPKAYFSKMHTSKIPLLLFYLGGVFFNIILVILIFLIARQAVEPIILAILNIAANVNIILVVITLIPVEYPFWGKPRPSDGLQILRIITNKTNENKKN